MGIIKVILKDSGSLAKLEKDFQVYKGSYQNNKIDIYVPVSFLPSVEGHTLAVKTACLLTSANGEQHTTIGYQALYSGNTEVIGNVTYRIYEQDLPRAFVKYAGDQTFVANVIEMDSDTVVRIVTSQTADFVVQNSAYVENEEIVDPSVIDLLAGRINALEEEKQDKTPVAPETQMLQNSWQDSPNVADAINNNTTQTEANRTQISTNTGNIATNTNDIGDIKAEQIIQNNNILANTNDINGTAGNPGLKQQVAELQAIVGTGETYLGTYTNSLDPNDSDQLAQLKVLLSAWAVDPDGGDQDELRGGDVVIYVQQISGTDRNYKFIYSGAISDWTFYEIPATESATNDTKGIVQGSYNASDTVNKTQVNIQNGEIEDIYIVDNNLAHRRVSEYINSENTRLTNTKADVQTNTNNISTNTGNISTLQGQMTNILNGSVSVGRATNADNDGNGNNIVNTYLTQTAGVTKTQLKDYALPRTFNDVSYLTSTGYSNEVPQSVSPIYTATSQNIGDTELFTAEKTIVNAEFEIGAKNSSVDTIYVSASNVCVVQFRLTTDIYVNSTWTTASVELSDYVQFNVADEIKKLQFGSTFTQLNNVYKLADGDKFRQKLEVVTSTSEELTFDVYSNETYPSTFYLNTTSQVIEVAQGRLGELPRLELVGTYDNQTDTITYRIPLGFKITNNVEVQYLLTIPTVVSPDEITKDTKVAVVYGVQNIMLAVIPTLQDSRTVPTINDLAGSIANNTIIFTGVFDVDNGDITIIADISGASGEGIDIIPANEILNSTLTQDQWEIITNGKPTQIIGTLTIGSTIVESPIIVYANVRSEDNYTEFFMFGARNVSDTYFYNCTVTYSTLQISIAQSLHFNGATFDIARLRNVNGKQYPTYPSDLTKDYVLHQDVTTGNLSWVDYAGKQDALDTTQMSAVNSGITSSDVTQIGTNTSAISTINGKIPSEASTSNQLADKNFVNSSIATQTANFIGTFANVTALESYSGTVTNNDYAFVTNQVLGTDYVDYTALNAVDKTTLTNFDYGWVINAEDNTKFDLYRFDIVEQAWDLRASKVNKADITLNYAYNRYKATVSNNTVTWSYEYTLNNSSFTAQQWEAINSGITSGDVAKLSGVSGNIVDTVSDQTITGQKTFTQNLNIGTGGNYIGTNGIQLTLFTGQSNWQTVFNSLLMPNIDNQISIGRTANRWKDLYLGGSLKDGTNSVSIADINNGLMNVINASDIVNNTLTQAQYDLITNGKQTQIIGTLLGLSNPIFYPSSTYGPTVKRGYVIGLNTSNYNVVGIYSISENIISIPYSSLSFSNANGWVTIGSRLTLGNLATLNHKDFPAYPTTNTNPQCLQIGANGGNLTWADLPSGGSSTVVLKKSAVLTSNVTINGTARDVNKVTLTTAEWNSLSAGSMVQLQIDVSIYVNYPTIIVPEGATFSQSDLSTYLVVQSDDQAEVNDIIITGEQWKNFVRRPKLLDNNNLLYNDYFLADITSHATNSTVFTVSSTSKFTIGQKVNLYDVYNHRPDTYVSTITNIDSVNNQITLANSYYMWLDTEDECAFVDYNGVETQLVVTGIIADKYRGLTAKCLSTVNMGTYGLVKESDVNSSYNTSATASKIAKYYTNGRLVVGTPVNNADATTKSYVDAAVGGKQDTTNLVTSVSSSSTDTQYPSAKCVYDLVGDVETLLTALNNGQGV